LLQLSEGWELDFSDVLAKGELSYLILFAVVNLRLVGPSQHAYDLIALEEGEVLNGKAGTCGTR
jgi:hypothetical protein